MQYAGSFIGFREAVKKKNMARINKTILSINVPQSDKDGNTLLHIVAEFGTIETAIQLLNLGANINTKNKNGKTPIICAIKNSIEMFRILVDHNPIDPDAKLIRHAIYFGNEEILQTLLQNMIVFKSGNFKNVENLIKYFLISKKYSEIKKTIYPMLIYFAAKIDSKNVLELILKDCRKHLGTRRENVADHPEEFNFRGDLGETALHYAVTQQRVDAVRFLLKKGADPNCKSNTKLTPLHYAARLENQEICELLLSFGASVNPNEDGINNPLHVVCGLGLGKIFHGFDEFTLDVFSHFNGRTIVNSNIGELLLKHGADPNRRGNLGKLILLHSCQTERFGLVEMLFKFNADLRVVDRDGNTALHHAATNKSSVSIVKFLVEKGHALDVKNNEGETPIFFLVRNSPEPYFSILEYLVYRGSDLGVKNKKNETILHVAMSRNRCDIVPIFLELGLDKILKNDSNFCSNSTHLRSCSECKQILIFYIAIKGNNINDISIGSDFDFMNEAKLIFDSTKSELEKLKGKKIVKDIGYSYYDFLARDLVTAMRIFKNPTLKPLVTRFYNSYSEFPFCRHLYQQRLRWINNLEHDFDEMVKFLFTFGKVRLTTDIIEMILSYLSVRDILLFSETNEIR